MIADLPYRGASQPVNPAQSQQPEPTLLELTLAVTDRELGKLRLNELALLFMEGRL